MTELMEPFVADGPTLPAFLPEHENCAVCGTASRWVEVRKENSPNLGNFFKSCGTNSCPGPKQSWAWAHQYPPLNHPSRQPAKRPLENGVEQAVPKQLAMEPGVPSAVRNASPTLEGVLAQLVTLQREVLALKHEITLLKNPSL